MEALADPTNPLWPFPFTPQDWAQTPPGCASLCAYPARRGQAAARRCGDTGGSTSAEVYDFLQATVIGLAIQEASPAHHHSHASQSGRETRASGPSPDALTTDDCARGAARAVCVWEHDVDSAQAVRHAACFSHRGDRADGGGGRLVWMSRRQLSKRLRAVSGDVARRPWRRAPGCSFMICSRC